MQLNNASYQQVKISDGANLDSFSRLRSSNPTNVFDCQFNYDLQPLIYEQKTSGSGATTTYDTTNNTALMTLSSTPSNGYAYMQSYEYFRYQPGKSQLVLITFNFIEQKTGCSKNVGLTDGVNGFEFQNNGSTNRFVIYSNTENGNQISNQADWNLDKLDGTGISGITLDITKGQILVIDFQALYKGRVRFGFDIGGNIIYCHEFNHSNLTIQPYIKNANLPIRCGMSCTTTTSTTMHFNCASIISEGGQEDIAGYEFSTPSCAVTAASGARTHILSIRPKTTFNSIVNRNCYRNVEISLIVTGNSPVFWELVLGQAITGTTTYIDINTSFSSMEYNTLGTISGSPILVIDSGYIAATASSKSTESMKLTAKYPIALNQAGVATANGTYSILVTGIGGASACSCALKFKEIR